MNQKLQIFLYGLGAFAIYMVLTLILIWISGNVPENPILFGIYTKEHLLLGLVVAAVLTFSHERKKKMMK